MYIEPIHILQGLNKSNKIDGKINETNDAFSFKSVFDNALGDYIDAENQVDEDIYKQSVGESDDLHNLMINTKKAEMSLDLFLQLRNKALEAYNEVMRMSV